VTTLSLHDPVEQWWKRACTSPNPLLMDDGTWFVHEPSQVRDVLRRWTEFSNDVPSERDRTLDFLLTADPPTHAVERVAFLQHFGPHLHHPDPTLRAAFTHCLDDALASGEPVDLLTQVCEPFGAWLGSETLGGLDLGVGGGRDPEAGSRAHLTSEIFNGSGGPAAALWRHLVEAGDAPETAEGKVVGLLTALVVAFTSTLPALVALVAWAELSARSDTLGPGGFEAGAAGAGGPLLGLYRTVVRAANVGSRRLDPGDRVLVSFAFAARSEGTANPPHPLVFGHGNHRCPASALSARATTVATSVLANRSGVRLVPGWIPEFRQGSHFTPLIDLMIAEEHHDLAG